MPSEHAQQRRMERMTVREEDVHDCDSVRQGHVSAFLVTSSEFARKSLASQLCLPTALAHGRFCFKYLSLSLSLSLSDELSHEKAPHQPWTPANAGT